MKDERQVKVIHFPEGDVEITPEKFPHIFSLLSDNPRKRPARLLDRSELPVRVDRMRGHFVESLLSEVD